jgi:tripartite-type tricarboxylate transporter receptor subunit TctC
MGSNDGGNTMPNLSRRAAVALAPGLAALLGNRSARAQPRFPDRPISIVSPFAAGGTSDVIARAVARGIEPRLGQPVVVENVTGAGGTLGIANVARAQPDGYRLVMGGLGSVVFAAGIHGSRLPYDARTALAPVAAVASVPTVIIVAASSPVRDLRQLVELARAKPGELTYGSPGAGGSLHLSGELFQRLARVELQHVPYRGGAPMMQDVLGGQIPVAFSDTTLILPLLSTGRIRPIAVLAPNRAASLPDVPTAAEAGLPGLEVETWYGLLAPAGVPRPVLVALSGAVIGAARAPGFSELLRGVGADPLFEGPDEFAAMLARDFERWLPIIRDARIEPT